MSRKRVGGVRVCVRLHVCAHVCVTRRALALLIAYGMTWLLCTILVKCSSQTC